MKDIKTGNLWTFELSSQEHFNVPIRMNVGFQQRDRQSSAMENEDTLYRPLVTNSQDMIGTEKYLDAGVLLD